MRWTLVVVGGLLILVGGVWMLQGAGVIGGSFMSGSSLWFVIGLICVLIGIAIVVQGVAAPQLTGRTTRTRARARLPLGPQVATIAPR